MWRVRTTNVPVGKKKYYIFWVCVFSLSHSACNAHATYCHLRNVLLYHICPYCLTNGTIFEKKLLYVKFVSIFSTNLSENFLIPWRIEWDRIKNIHWFLFKALVILVRSYWNLTFPDRFSKNTQIWNFMKIHPVGAELFHAGRRTDMTKLVVGFREFPNSPKRDSKCKIYE